jgi:acyl-CoA synthetase (AMP-forming)/AMP-acid ligase II
VLAKDFLEQVEDLAKGFIAAGIRPGDAVAIMSRTRYEWALVDYALWFAGAVCVPIYETSAPAQIEWVLSDSNSVALFVETAEHQRRFETIKSSVPSVKQVWKFDDDSLVKLVAKGREISSEQLEQARTSHNLDSLATIIYTSGTSVTAAAYSGAWRIGDFAATANGMATNVMSLFNPMNTTYNTTFISDTTFPDNTVPATSRTMCAGSWRVTTAMEGIKFIASNNQTARVTIYGMRKS